MTVKQAYLAELAAKGYQSDPAQLRAVDALQRCADEWAQYKARRSNAIKKLINRPEIPRGVYMYGGVGRGKSFLMECFFDAVPLKRKVRLHFHEFMREVHRELAALQGTVNPLDVLGERIAKRYKLICFDEFHVADITDAMILHRLLVALFDNGVGFVTTSNFKPDDLYPGGLHRDRILPAIALLKERMEVVNVDNGTDYRRRTLEDAKLYHCPLGQHADAAMQQTFDRLAEAHDEEPVMQIETRLMERSGSAVTNFEASLPKPQSDLARESLKDPYRFDFLGLTDEAQEREVEHALVKHVTEFLLELGAGFAFVGRQVMLNVGGDEFFIDLLFYHLKLRCYVVIELKGGKFKPEHLGQLGFYLTAVDMQVKAEQDNPTIGLLLCKTKNKVVAEYALRDTAQPIGVAEYQLIESLPAALQTSLPSIEQIESELGGGE